MVIYDLICDSYHEFEGWFKKPEDVDAQRSSGLLTCPFCESSNITKKPTAAKLVKKSNSLSTQSMTVADGQELVSGKASSGKAPEKFAHLQKMLTEVHDFIDKNFEDVGSRFSEEAISIHHGEKDPANIRGTASRAQIKEMAEQGVNALPLPAKPIDRKKIN